MIRRIGWVSNSSSSSFICDVCGCAESGYNASASDFDMTYFEECGHTVCDSEYTKDVTKLTLEQRKIFVNGFMEEEKREEFMEELYPGKSYWRLEDSEMRIIDNKFKVYIETISDEYYTDEVVEEALDNCNSYELPSVFCPVCNLDAISDSTLLEYIVKDKKINLAGLRTSLKADYKTLDALRKYTRGE